MALTASAITSYVERPCDLIQFLSCNLPGSNLWYVQAAPKHLWWEQLLKLTDPKAEAVMRREADTRKRKTAKLLVAAGEARAGPLAGPWRRVQGAAALKRDFVVKLCGQRYAAALRFVGFIFPARRHQRDAGLGRRKPAVFIIGRFGLRDDLP